MMAGQEWDRDDVYRLLREVLVEYSELTKSAEMEIFAIEMEVVSGKSDSADPALLDEFKKAFPKKVTLREGFLTAADYVDRELIGLRHVEAARTVVSDLRVAAARPEAMSDILRHLFEDKGG